MRCLITGYEGDLAGPGASWGRHSSWGPDFSKFLSSVLNCAIFCQIFFIPAFSLKNRDAPRTGHFFTVGMYLFINIRYVRYEFVATINVPMLLRSFIVMGFFHWMEILVPLTNTKHAEHLQNCKYLNI